MVHNGNCSSCIDQLLPHNIRIVTNLVNHFVLFHNIPKVKVFWKWKVSHATFGRFKCILCETTECWVVILLTLKIQKWATFPCEDSMFPCEDEESVGEKNLMQ